MDPTLALALGLFLIAVLLFVLDVFVPSGGVLSISAAVLGIAGVVAMFRYDTTWGAASLLGLLILAPMAVAFMLKVWPHTPLGRRIIGKPREEEAEEEKLAELKLRQQRETLLGRQGKALTELRPVGTIEVDGVRHEALSETTYVKAGQGVRITSVDLAHIRVRPMDESGGGIVQG